VRRETHVGKQRADQRRQQYLEERGLKVLRFWDTEVYENLEGVLQTVYEECLRRGGQDSRQPVDLEPYPDRDDQDWNAGPEPTR